jgi:hypothetical protein
MMANLRPPWLHVENGVCAVHTQLGSRYALEERVHAYWPGGVAPAGRVQPGAAATGADSSSTGKIRVDVYSDTLISAGSAAAKNTLPPVATRPPLSDN